MFTINQFNYNIYVLFMSFFECFRIQNMPIIFKITTLLLQSQLRANHIPL
jgi:hypothetical protein